MTQCMYNCMSITKGVIGFLYGHHGLDTSLELLPGVTVEDALCHRTGCSDDGTFDYTGYRAAAAEGRAKTFARLQLHTLQPGTFAYNNSVWHLLSAHFQEQVGMSCATALQRIIGMTDWLWEHTADRSRTSLGPHGLYLSEPALQRLLPYLQTWLASVPYKLGTPVPVDHWSHLGADVCRGRTAYYGWWFRGPSLAWGHGYYAQFMVFHLPQGAIHCSLQRGDDAYIEDPTRLVFLSDAVAGRLAPL